MILLILGRDGNQEVWDGCHVGRGRGRDEFIKGLDWFDWGSIGLENGNGDYH